MTTYISCVYSRAISVAEVPHVFKIKVRVVLDGLHLQALDNITRKMMSQQHKK